MARAKPRKTATVHASAAAALENIESPINGNGAITLGSIASIPCAATASDDDQCLAMLVRHPGESLLQFIQRLDAAIASAYEDGRYIDEINCTDDFCDASRPQVKTVTAGRLLCKGVQSSYSQTGSWSTVTGAGSAIRGTLF